MKIGILTQPLEHNYGGLLQNYALQQVLLKAGHEVKTLDWQYRHVPFKVFLADKIKTNVLSHFNYCFKNWHFLNRNEKNYLIEDVLAFKDTQIHKTKVLNNRKEIKRCAESERFDAFIVGSDQCWRRKYNIGYLDYMYLGFLHNEKRIKKVAYAASFGTEYWEYNTEETLMCSDLAQRFDLITVREESGIKLCRDYLKVEAVHVLDPALLLEVNDYKRLIDESFVDTTSSILATYILDKNEEIEETINGIANNNQLYRVELNPESYNFRKGKGLNFYKKQSVPNWLSYIYNAKMTIVDSFHGMVFSIIFNKPFWVIGNLNRGMSRFESLLKLFDLENRLVDIDSIDKKDINEPINWEIVNGILEKKRKESLNLLLESLK